MSPGAGVPPWLLLLRVALQPLLNSKGAGELNLLGYPGFGATSMKVWIWSKMAQEKVD